MSSNYDPNQNQTCLQSARFFEVFVSENSMETINNGFHVTNKGQKFSGQSP